jgi:hypothetical protein
MLVHLALSSPKGHTVVARRGVDSAPCTNPRPTAFSTRVAHFKRPLPLVQPSSPLPTAFLHPRRDTIALSPPLVVPPVTAPLTALLLSRTGPGEPRCPGAAVGALGAAPPSPEPSCVAILSMSRHASPSLSLVGGLAHS